ncbi:MAG: peptidylprolyl isomerase [Chloroflexota bacterium]
MPSPVRPAARRVAALAALLLVAACSGTAAPTSTIPPVGSIAPSGSPATSGSPAPSESHPAEATYPPGCPTTQPAALPAGETRTVTLATAKGDIVIKVDGSLAPIAAGNFVALVECHFYDGIIFHRLIPKFIIQAGDGAYGRMPYPNPDFVGYGQLPYKLKDEPVTTPYRRGTVAMARTSKPDSADSQFFIVLDDSADATLGGAKGPNNYQIFGTVTSGIDAVDAIAATPNSGAPNYLAMNPIAITKATVGK